MAERDSKHGRFLRIASPAGLKWCYWHQAHEPLVGFGPCVTRPDGLQPLCRVASSEKQKLQNSQKPGYIPRTHAKTSGPAPSGMKWCNHHAAFCQIDTFTADPRKADGLQGSCRTAGQERYHIKNGSVPQRASKYNPGPSGMKWCTFHQKHEALEGFGDKAFTKRDKSGKQGSCREGQAEYTVIHAAEFSARCHTRRARRMGNGGTHNAEDIADIRRMQRDRCALCAIPLRGKGVKDHIIPLKLGGHNGKRNIQLLCRPCNGKKHARHPLDHARSLGLLL